MAAANDNQGLKIAVAALVMLVFILAVTNYFAFSSSSQNFAKFEDMTKKKADADTQARNSLEAFNYAKGAMGFANLEDLEAVKAAQTKHQQATAGEIQAIGTEMGNALNALQQAGGADPKIDDLKTVGAGLINGYVSEPNENKVNNKTIDRLKDLLVNQSRLMLQVSLDYRKLRGELGSANATNAAQLAKVEAARDAAVKETLALTERFKTDLANLNDTITNLQNTDKEKTNSITDLTNKYTDESNKLVSMRKDLGRTIGDLRDKLEQKTDILPSGKAIGRITYVDYLRGEARVSVNKGDGARPMMRFTIFDASAQGVPTDKPKGSIELIEVGDRDSLAKLTVTKDPTNPMRYNDQLYSPAFTPDSPQRFALIGKQDMNRDGKDDRADLIRLIERSGGQIEYDLAPPGSDRGPGRQAVERTFTAIKEPIPARTGLSWGKVSMARAYIIDDRIALSGENEKDGAGLTAEDVAYNKERSEAIKEARLSGVPPMQLSRLLTELGYSPPPPGFGSGNLESKDRPALRQLLKPKPVTPGANAPALEKNPNDAPAAAPAEKETATEPK
jgi:uncharacterized coiled-coil protein SlyX